MQLTPYINLLERVLNRLTKFIQIMLTLYGMFLIWMTLWSTSPYYQQRVGSLFTPREVILDIRDGSMTRLNKWLQSYPRTLVIFYAPWSAKCLKHKTDLVDAYQRVHKKILFVAINCWTGSCAVSFPTFYFPRIFLYVGKHAPIEYLDDIRARKIIDFIRSSIRPFVYIGSESQLEKFQHSHDSFILSYISYKNMIKDEKFNTIYHISLDLINKVNSPRIGVILNQNIAKKLNLSYHGDICAKSIFTPYTHYPNFLNYTSESILHWILTTSKKVVNVLVPSPVNTEAIKQSLKKSPAAILFFSKTDSEFLLIFRRAALAYYQYDYLLQNPCISFLKQDFCISYVTNTSICNLCQRCLSNCVCVCKNILASIYNSIKFQSCKGKTCCLQGGSYYFNLYYINNCHPFNSRYSKIGNVTERILENYSSLRQYVQKRISRLRDVESECFQQSVANYSLTVNDNNSFQNLHIDTQNSSRISNFYSQDTTRKKMTSACCDIINNTQSDILDGLAYRTNRTLNFYVMDSEEHSNIMTRFEIQKSLSLLILDMQSEASYTMDSNMDFSSIGTFIIKFTNGTLVRNHALIQQQPSHPIYNHNQNKDIIELTSTSFYSTVMESTQSVLVMFYTKWCGICKAIKLLYLQLMQSYRKKNLLYARIDGESNILPWRFTASIYPSFVLFPANRKHQSIAFPDDMEYTLGNFVKFLNWELKK